MIRLVHALKNTSPAFRERDFSPGLMLGNLPNYDSLNAINLHMALQKEFSAEFAFDELPLWPSKTVQDLADCLTGKGIKLSPL